MRFLLVAAAFDAALDAAVEAGATLDAAVADGEDFGDADAADLVDARKVDPHAWLVGAKRNELKASKYRKLSHKIELKVVTEHAKTEQAFEGLKHALDGVEPDEPGLPTASDLSARLTKQLVAEAEAEHHLQDAQKQVRAVAAKALRGARAAGVQSGKDQEAENVTTAMSGLEAALVTQSLKDEETARRAGDALDARASHATQVVGAEEAKIRADAQTVAQLEQRGAYDATALQNATAQVAALSANTWQQEHHGLVSAEQTVAAVDQTFAAAAQQRDQTAAANAEVAKLRAEVQARAAKRSAVQLAWHEQAAEQLRVQQAQAELRVTDSQLDASRKAEQEMVLKLEQIRDASNQVSASLVKSKPAAPVAAQSAGREADAQEFAANLAARAQANNQALVEKEMPQQWAPLRAPADLLQAAAPPAPPAPPAPAQAAQDLPALDLD